VIDARLVGSKTRAALEHTGAALAGQRCDSSGIGGSWSIAPDPRGSSQPDDRHVSIHVYPGVFRSLGGGAARSGYPVDRQPRENGSDTSFEDEHDWGQRAEVGEAPPYQLPPSKSAV
jgi:hypothetical protein